MSLRTQIIICTIFCSIFNKCASYNGPIGGDKSIADCINGDRKENSDLERTPVSFNLIEILIKFFGSTQCLLYYQAEIIREQGYPAEDHVVLTEDGYLLTLNRIPGKPNAPAVLVQHGLVFSAFDWIAAGKNKALGNLISLG